MTTLRPAAPVAEHPAPADSDSLELRILAYRAVLLNTLTPGIMHHLANAGQGLVAAETSPEAIAQVAVCLEKARRVIGTLVSELTLGAATDSGDPRASVDEVLADVEVWQGCQITLPRVRVIFDPHPLLPLGGIRADHLRDALAAVVTNAKEAMAGFPAGEIHIAAEVGSGWITISVMDEGPGIDLTTLARLFAPYNSTKRGGTHLGLGLSLARELLTRVGGDLSITASQEQPHTRVRMRIPVSSSHAGSGPGSVVSDVGGPARSTRTQAPGGPGAIRAAA